MTEKGPKPEMASSQHPEAGLPNMMLPRALERRKRVVKAKSDDLRKQVKMDFEDLQQRYEVCKDKEEAFLEWGKSHVETHYAGLCEDVAHAVPYCYVGRQDIRDEQKTGLFQHTQESQIRGDSALCRVALALRLLSFKREIEILEDASPRTGTYPLMIMSGIMNEHILKWPERVHEQYEDIKCPDMAKQRGREFNLYYTKPRDDRGEIDLLVLDRQAHVIFFEIKAYGTHRYKTKHIQSEEKCGPMEDKVSRNPWKDSFQQLLTARKTFKIMFPEEIFRHINVHRVIAMPNISLEDAQEDFGFDTEELKKQMVHVLTKEDVIDEEYYFDKAESQYDLSKFEDWWRNNLITDSTPELSPDLMKTIVARYIGTLSRPLGMELNQQRNQIRTPCDAIEFSSTVYKSLCYYFKENEKENKKSVMELLKCPPDDPYKRMHIKGPPGSGRTTLAILKAKQFLECDSTEHQQLINTQTQRHVIVIDIYRGARGRSLGMHVYYSILEVDKKYEGKVHYLPLDANMNISKDQFAKEVNDIIERGKHMNTNNLMFIIDEILPIRFWENILMALDHDIYEKSHVWITDGLVPQDLGQHQRRFRTKRLRSITRIPPTVQKVLYHVDWCENKEEKYQPDQHDGKAPQEEADSMINTSVCRSTRGPIPVCIRHEDHTTAAILDCDNCAEELADLLEHKLRLVCCTDKILPCSIVILFSIPSGLYTDADEGHVDITRDRCEQYAEKIRDCRFVKCLCTRLPEYINILTKVEEDQEKKDLEKEEFWNTIFVCWVDKFQGLVKDIVIYLPSETFYLPETPGKSVNPTDQQKTQTFIRKIPWPGTSENPANKQHPAISFSAQSSSLETTESPLSQPKSGRSQTDRDTSDQGKSERREVDRRLAGMYWSKEDVDRYTEWDQTNLMFAASRCTAQLILIVP